MGDIKMDRDADRRKTGLWDDLSGSKRPCLFIEVTAPMIWCMSSWFKKLKCGEFGSSNKLFQFKALLLHWWCGPLWQQALWIITCRNQRCNHGAFDGGKHARYWGNINQTYWKSRLCFGKDFRRSHGNFWQFVTHLWPLLVCESFLNHSSVSGKKGYLILNPSRIQPHISCFFFSGLFHPYFVFQTSWLVSPFSIFFLHLRESKGTPPQGTKALFKGP